MAQILIVDDQEMMRDSLSAIFARAGHHPVISDGAAAALQQIAKNHFDIIVSDLKMPKIDGLAFLDELKRLGIETPVIMMTAYATVATAVEAMKKGAFDYIQKPFEADEIILLVERVLEHHRLARENEAYRTNAHDWQRDRKLIGASAPMQSVLQKIDLIARTSATVLIRGESGTGKELVARALHNQSPRANKPLLCVNCAALSRTLLESELFGHEKGAFTGADRMRKGRFELADRGTLLLDEISEMDLKLQAKLLRVLQEREFERVGSSMVRHVDVRLIATSNRDLEQWVRQGKFREDLFYRLNVVPIEVPPLRERRDDLEILCEHFLARSAEREGAPLRILSNEALQLLSQYPWPGNVRELENLMERASILTASDIITPEVLCPWLNIQQVAPVAERSLALSMHDNRPHLVFGTIKLADMERRMIEETLEKFQGHRQKTAEALGIGVRTLTMKLKRWKDEQSLTASAIVAEPCATVADHYFGQ